MNKIEDISNFNTNDFHSNYYESLSIIKIDDDHEITSISPLSLYNDNNFIIMNYLAKVKSGKLVILAELFNNFTNNDIKYLKENIPFYVDIETISTNSAKWNTDGLIIDTLPIYITNLNIEVENNELNSDNKFYIDSIYSIKNNLGECELKSHKFFLSPNILTSLVILENYILNKNTAINDLDLNTAITIGKNKPIDSSIFISNKINDKISIASIDKNNIMAICKFEYLTDDNIEFINLAILYDIEDKINKNKFDITLDDIKSMYKNNELYMTQFFFNITINNNLYYMYYANDISNTSKLIIIDESVYNSLSEIIDNI